MKIYLVCGSITANPEFDDWVVAAYSDRSAAESHREAAARFASIPWSERKGIKNPHDDSRSGGSDHAIYSVVEMPLLDSFPPKNSGGIQA